MGIVDQVKSASRKADVIGLIAIANKLYASGRMSGDTYRKIVRNYSKLPDNPPGPDIAPAPPQHDRLSSKDRRKLGRKSRS